MKHYKLVLFLVACSLLLGACASSPGRTAWYQDWRKCAAAGAASGLAAGIADDDAIAAGAVGGALIGGVICAMSDTDADGVKNHKDKCPGTTGSAVDERGCETDIDSDGDGIVDRLDECPATPAGAAVDSRGCEADSDRDGVVDRLDQCPNTPAGAAVNAKGCELDSDGDGVVDRLDKCPATPAATPVDNAGCTLALTVRLEGVNFEHDSARLTPQSTSILDGVVEIMKRHSDLMVEIAGHTDSQGSAEYNQGLSLRRAQAVREYLVSHGVIAGNMTVSGYGETEPVADNATGQGRAANRRVELRQK